MFVIVRLHERHFASGRGYGLGGGGLDAAGHVAGCHGFRPRTPCVSTSATPRTGSEIGARGTHKSLPPPSRDSQNSIPSHFDDDHIATAPIVRTRSLFTEKEIPMLDSDALWESNRRNAAKSTGPKTPEGKAASSKNALKHGLTATEILLPNEDRDAYDARLQTWLDHDKPTDPGHVAAIERLVYTQNRLDRCTRHETESTRQRLLHAFDHFDADALAATYELGRRLIDDPFNRAIPPSPVPGDPPPSTTPAPITINLPKQQRWVDDEPAVLLLQLQRSAQGVDWLLARWRELLHILNSELSWNYYYQNRAIRLLGKRVEDLFDDQESRKIILGALAAGKDAQVWGLLDIAKQSMLGAAGRIDDACRVEYAATLAPATPEQGRDVLRAIVNDEIDRLMRLKSRAPA